MENKNRLSKKNMSYSTAIGILDAAYSTVMSSCEDSPDPEIEMVLCKIADAIRSLYWPVETMPEAFRAEVTKRRTEVEWMILELLKRG